MRIGQRGSLNLEADDTRGYRDNGSTDVQWLLRGGYTLALGPNSALSLGVRRIQGTQPIVDVAQAMSPVNASNLSFAYHARIPHAEVYVAYGDASRFATVPQLIVKVVRYFGADKGT
jgi:hypothetical protein